MKSIFIFCLCFTLTFAQQLPSNKNDCPNTNQFILEIKKIVPLYNEPFYGYKMCGSEFTTYGTCCNPWSLPSYASEDNRKVMLALHQINYEYTRFEGALSTLFTNIKRLAFAPFHPNNPSINIAINVAKDILKNQTVQRYFASYTGQNVPSPAEFNRTNTECWTKIMQARNTSICYSCSGRSKYFFTGQGKAILSMQTCQNFISVCKVPLGAMGFLTKALVDLVEISKSTLKAGIQVQLEEKIRLDKLKIYDEVFASAHIPELIHAYNTGSGSNFMDFGVLLCSKFVRLRETTLIEKLYELFSLAPGPWRVDPWGFLAEHIAAHRNVIDPLVKNFEAEFSSVISQTTSLWSSNLRRLQSTSELGVLGTDAVIYKQTDGQYRSYTGAPGTEPMCATCAPSPMDMSTQFP